MFCFFWQDKKIEEFENVYALFQVQMIFFPGLRQRKN